MSASGEMPVDPVLVIHNRYQQRAGEDAQVDAEIDVLRSNGHEVHRFIVDNRSIAASPRARLRTATAAVWSPTAARRLADAVAQARPAVAHVHNTFPLLSAAIYPVLADAGIPVVQSLHNYRWICPSANLFRDGAVCRDCVGRRLALPAVVHACYRESRPMTAMVAAASAVGRTLGRRDDAVDLYLTPSNAAAELLIAGGLPADRIVVKPNAVAPDPGPGPSGPRPATFLYVGRLAPEKGIETLLAAWAGEPSDASLRVAGSGPLEGRVGAAAARDPRIDPRGTIDRATVTEEMRAARALVFPSEWDEPFGLSIIEAFANATPVIAARIGGPAELVDDGRTGMLYEPGDVDGLADRLAWALGHADEMAGMGREARTVFEARYTADQEYRRLVDAYRTAIRARSMRDDPARPTI